MLKIRENLRSVFLSQLESTAFLRKIRYKLHTNYAGPSQAAHLANQDASRHESELQTIERNQRN